MKPKLRFKNFNNEWEEIELRNIASEIAYGMNSASKEYDGENKYIRITDIDENSNRYSNKDVVSPDGILEDRFLVKENDILFARTGASTGKTYLYNSNDGKLYYAGFLIKASIINHNSNFIFQQTKLNKYNNWIKIMSMRSGQPGINSQEYGSYRFSITNIDEENKVSNFLSLIDKKIELQSKKIEDLKLFKKGLINKELNNLNDCKSISLNELGTTYSGLYGKTKEDFENGNCKFINFMSVLKDNIDVSSLTTVKINPNEKQNKVEKGDLFFMTSSETKEEVALCSTLSYDVKNLYLNSFCFGYRINNLNLINNEYLNCLLHSPKYRKQISNLGQGFTRVNISKNKLLELLVEVPDMKQQIRIVSINNKINYKINSEINKLNKLNELKKGLMQNMFV